MFSVNGRKHRMGVGKKQILIYEVVSPKPGSRFLLRVRLACQTRLAYQIKKIIDYIIPSSLIRYRPDVTVT